MKNKFTKTCLESLESKYDSEIKSAKANLIPYLGDMPPVGIGEHSDLTETVEKEIQKIANAQEMLDAIEKVKMEFLEGHIITRDIKDD